MSVDFRELEEFRDKIANLSEDGTRQICEECSKELAGRLLAKVVKRTPVGQRPDEFNGEEGKKKRKETVTVTSENGKKRKFLTADAARYQQYWAGYVGGTLRRGWTGGKQANPVQYANGMPVRHIGSNYKIDIVNEVEYAQYVEYGHRQTPGRYVPALGKALKASWVKGQFMMTKSEAEVDAIAQSVVDKKVQKYLEGSLGND